MGQCEHHLKKKKKKKINVLLRFIGPYCFLRGANASLPVDQASLPVDEVNVSPHYRHFS